MNNLMYKLGETVFVITDKEQNERIVVGILIRPQNSVIYLCALIGEETSHYAFELTKEKDFLKASL